MTKEVISVNPETSLTDAARILMEKEFDGLPVIDRNNVLVGILTQYDMISKGTALHLPTIQVVLENISVFNKDKKQFQKSIREITSLAVHDVMNDDPLTFQETDTYEHAVKVFHDHHRVNPIPVIDKEKHVLGIVSRYDIIKPFNVINE